MGIEFRADSLLPRLQQATSIVLASNVVPLLDNVCVTVTPSGDITFLTSDGDMSVSFTAQSACEKCPDSTLEFCADAKKLCKTLSNMRGYTISMETNGSVLDFKYRRSSDVEFTGEFHMPEAGGVSEFKAYINGKSGEDERTAFGIPVQDFKRCIEKTSHAASTDSLRPMMNGVHFDIEGGSITAVASDGRALVRYTDKTSGICATSSFTLPNRLCNLLTSINDNGTMVIGLTPTHVMMTHESFTINSRLIEGKYPNYNSVIPQRDNVDPFSLSVNNEALTDALKNVLPFSSKMDMRIKMEIKGDVMSVIGENTDYSSLCRENVDITAEGCGDCTLSVNGSLLSRAIESYGTGRIRISGVKEDARLIIITEEEQGGANETLSLIMLMQN